MVAFGSLAHGAWFGPRSDIDLAVEGVPANAFCVRYATTNRGIIPSSEKGCSLVRIVDILWLPDIIDKLASKHDVEPHEVEQVLARQPRFRRIQRGKVRGEDLYAAIGQTESGRYLIVFFIRKMSGSALVISARDLDPGERRQYERK